MNIFVIKLVWKIEQKIEKFFSYEINEKFRFRTIIELSELIELLELIEILELIELLVKKHSLKRFGCTENLEKKFSLTKLYFLDGNIQRIPFLSVFRILNGIRFITLFWVIYV